MTWDILLECGVKELPVDLNAVCRHLGVRTLDYFQGRPIIKELGLENRWRSNDGFLVRCDGQALIFYHPSIPEPRRRFTIAHEIGHYVLGHGGDLVNREPSSRDNPIEQEANRFAASLLSPACVFWGMDVSNAAVIAEYSNISYRAAQFRSAELLRLLARDRESMRLYGHPYFLRSKKEEELYRRFLPYIRANRPPYYGQFSH